MESIWRSLTDNLVLEYLGILNENSQGSAENVEFILPLGFYLTLYVSRCNAKHYKTANDPVRHEGLKRVKLTYYHQPSLSRQIFIV